ncbi:DNA repair protein REV1 [Nakaseomyces bracarensis]|uniref:DNA repair protein REV1 n=1 Tax=Nakaseomyces bracarensis TaxID=273131 RepID=A0ABR4NNZ8_9SACH
MGDQGKMEDDLLERLLEDEGIFESESPPRTPTPSPSPSRDGPGTKKNFGRREYFYEKARKQREEDQKLKRQLLEVRSPSEFNNRGYPQIFDQLVIYINGFTTPGRFELHQMIVVHGGKFLHHLSAKRSVTHIIASNLPLKKRIEFANYKVVKPNWIVDSIEKGELLPWRDYALINNVDPNQPKLDSATPGSGSIVDCTSPSFIQDYFKHSRLHHLSTWKIDLRAKFLKEFIENNANLRKPRRHIDTFTVFHIDFDCFFATVAYLTKDPAIKCDINTDVIVVCHGSKNSDIASCNYVARKYGIKNGMWVGHAQTLLPKDVKMYTLPYNFDQIQNKSEQFYKSLGSLNVFDMILPISIDEAVCVKIDIEIGSSQGSDSRNGEDSQSVSNEELCMRIRKLISETTGGCTVSIGCASSLILARLALKKAKPNGYYITNKELLQSSQDKQDEFFGSFALKDLPGVGRAIVSKLQATFNNSKPMSLIDLKKCATMDTLKSAIGVNLGTKIYRALEGLDNEESSRMIFEPEEYFERKSLSIEINWGIRFDNINDIDDFIDRCCDYLLEKMNELDRKVSQISLKIMRRAKGAPIDPPKYMGMGRCDALNRSSRLGVPTNEHGTIATEIKAIFRTFGCPPKELRGVSVQFNKLVKSNVDITDKKRGVLNLFDTTPKLKFSPEKSNVSSPKKSPIDPNSIEKRSPVKGLKNLRELYQNKYDIPSTFEAQFLDALPTQLKSEVSHELRIKRKVEDMKVIEIKKKRKLNEEKEKTKFDHFFGLKSLFEPIKFQDQTSFKDICLLVKQWVHLTLKDNGPHDKDVRLFEKYANKLCNTNRSHFLSRIAYIISTELNLMEREAQNGEGFHEWELILMKRIIPLLNQNKHTFQTERKLDIEYDIG